MRKQLKDFIEQIGKDAVAVIPAAHEVTRSYDTEFKFHQDPDFFYLTGFPEPDAVAVIDPSNKKNPYTLFVRPRDPEMETWYGRREGVDGAKKNYGVDKALPIEKFETELAKMLNGKDKLYYRFGVDNKLDQTILQYLSGQRFRRIKTAYPPHTIIDPTIIMGEMRLHKTEDEIKLMHKAGEIAAEAHILAMQACKPGMNELQIEAMMEAYMRDQGASGVAYNSIIGGGDNACILHYVENNCDLKDGDLLLIDAGANYKGYASDITRTFPVNGRFTKPQRDVYDIVLDVQLKCIEATKTGNTIKERQDFSIELVDRRNETTRTFERQNQRPDQKQKIYEILYARRRTLSRLGRSRRGQIFHRPTGQKLAPVRAGNGFDGRAGIYTFRPTIKTRPPNIAASASASKTTFW